MIKVVDMSDAQLHRSIEKVFGSTEARVVAAYKVYTEVHIAWDALKAAR